jgi:hypothetical protein
MIDMVKDCRGEVKATSIPLDFGVPREIAEVFGVQDQVVENLNIHFDNKSFGKVTIDILITKSQVEQVVKYFNK